MIPMILLLQRLQLGHKEEWNIKQVRLYSFLIFSLLPFRKLSAAMTNIDGKLTAATDPAESSHITDSDQPRCLATTSLRGPSYTAVWVNRDSHATDDRTRRPVNYMAAITTARRSRVGGRRRPPSWISDGRKRTTLRHTRKRHPSTKSHLGSNDEINVPCCYCQE